MDTKKATILISNMDEGRDTNLTPRARITMPVGSPECRKNSNSEAYMSPAATFSSPSGQPQQFLCLP